MTSLPVYAAVAIAIAFTEPRRSPEYLVTAAPVTVGAPNGDLCVAVDVTDPHGVWWWEPGPAGCSTRSTGPGVFHGENASVTSLPAPGIADVQFRVRLIGSTSQRDVTIEVQLHIDRAAIRAMPTGSKVSILRRKNLEVPGFDGVPQNIAARSRTIPAAVMNALTKKFPQASIEKWTVEKEDGHEVYDIEFKQANHKFEADILADGRIDNWEQQIAVGDLPQPVTQTVSRLFPKGVLKEVMAMTVITDGTEHLEGYEIVMQRRLRKDVELTIAPDGKILEGPKRE